jgi:hypothetical protein
MEDMQIMAYLDGHERQNGKRISEKRFGEQTNKI